MISHEIRQSLREGKVENGHVVVSLPSGGAGVIVLDKGNDPEHKDVKKLLAQDTTKPLLKIFLPKTAVVPIEKGKLIIDPWQEVFLVDYESSGRRREFWIHLLSSGGTGGAAPPAGAAPQMAF